MTAAPAHVELANIGPNTHVDCVYSLQNPQIGTTRAGKPYLKCILRDATGEITARHWSFDDREFDDVSATGFVRVSGHSQVYNGQLQFIIENIRSADVTSEEMKLLLPTSKHDIDEMFASLRGILDTLEHPAMQALARAYLDDADLMDRFRHAPAATSLHHSWLGGLLEHTLQLVKLADAMLPHYPQLNRDLIVMGLFLHDLGKTYELTWERGFGYTVDGNLIGHIARGAILLQFKAAISAKQSGHRLPPDALRVLQHIILSHHGQPEYGAAKIPATPEAIFVAHLDNLDARTEMALHAASRDNPGPGGEFTDRIWALGTRIYRPDPFRDEEPA